MLIYSICLCSHRRAVLNSRIAFRGLSMLMKVDEDIHGAPEISDVVFLFLFFCKKLPFWNFKVKQFLGHIGFQALAPINVQGGAS